MSAHLWEKRPLVLGFLDAVGHQPFHGFGAVLVELTEVWRQIASSHHEDNLRRRGEGEKSKMRIQSSYSKIMIKDGIATHCPFVDELLQH